MRKCGFCASPAVRKSTQRGRLRPVRMKAWTATSSHKTCASWSSATVLLWVRSTQRVLGSCAMNPAQPETRSVGEVALSGGRDLALGQQPSQRARPFSLPGRRLVCRCGRRLQSEKYQRPPLTRTQDTTEAASALTAPQSMMVHSMGLW